MENKEFYSGEQIPQEEMERLAKSEYPNFVSLSLLNQLDLTSKKVLDAGAGPNTSLAKFVGRKGGEYIPFDIRADLLKKMDQGLAGTEVPFLGVVGDVRHLPFADASMDVTHQRFVLMNIKKETREEALRELLRVTKDILVLLEYNWRTMKSSEDPETTQAIVDVAFDFFSRFSTDPYMGEQFEELFAKVDKDLVYELRSFDRAEDVSNCQELLMVLEGMRQATDGVLHDAKLTAKFDSLIEKIRKSPFAFVPPRVATAVVRI